MIAYISRGNMEELVREWRASVLRGEKTDELPRQSEKSENDRSWHNPLAKEESVEEDCSHAD